MITQDEKKALADAARAGKLSYSSEDARSPEGLP